MARIHSAKQRQSDKRWDFTVSSDEEHWCHATGYCAGFEHPDEIDKKSEEHGWPKLRPEERDRMLEHQAKFHSDGHATAKEASDCHDEYELDFELRFGEEADTQKKCASCGEFTTGRATLGTFGHYVLCKAHQTRDDAKKTRDEERAKRQAARL